ncbi:transglycosylase family protein [Kitasatospora sp. NPDC101176]|uniref:LysM peptidoglycan-binding domain-containing protein n=1 Tax=Kitasatospora sp. NPDC101176 TaxID=3364099 RepID=UPI003822C2FE
MILTGSGRHRRPGAPTRAASKAAVAVTATAGIALPIAAATSAQAAPAVPDSAAPQWDQLASCESGGNWHINTGNGYYGGLQFDKSTWLSVRGTSTAPTADKATREEQIAAATTLYKHNGGWSAWPSCSAKLGLKALVPQAKASDKLPERAVTPEPKAATKPPVRAVTPDTKASEKTPARSGHGSYTVREGDTLSGIALAHGTTWQDLHHKNAGSVADPNVIRVGQTITL